MTSVFAPRRLGGAHAQTILGTLLKPTDGVRYRRERLDTPDGDFLDLDFVDVPGRTWSDLAGAPIVLLLHGLGGDARGGYSVATYRALATLGIRAVGMNYRGCGGTPNRRARLFHAGATEDPRFVLETLAARYPDISLAEAGFSLGGHMLVRAATEEVPLPATLRGIVSVSSPLDLHACASCLERGMGRVYSRWILRHLRAFVHRKLATGWKLTDEDRAEGRRDPDFEGALKATTIRAFDEALIAPLHGFRDAADYYAQASAGPRLGAITVPTTMIRADDDPFLDNGELDLPGLRNPAITLVRTAHGGHVGFVHLDRRGPRFWVEPTVARRLCDILLT